MKKDREKKSFPHYYLQEIFKDPKNFEEFKKIFNESQSYEECSTKLKIFQEKHLDIVGPVPNKKFISSCFNRARREEFNLKKVSGSAEARILKETPEIQELFKELWVAHASRREILDSLAKKGSKHIRNYTHIWNAAVALNLPERKETKGKETETETKKPEYQPFGPNHWPEAEIIQVSKEQWDKPGKRIFYLSRLDFESEGYRQGLVHLAAQIAAQEGCHFPVFTSLISKDWFRENEKKYLTGIPREDREWMREQFIQEVAKGISSAIPQIKNPQGAIIKWYVMASRPYDGPYGDLVLRKLEELRPDIRKYAQGGERVEIYNVRGKDSIYHGIVLPKKGRLPSGYMSTGPEREIKDIESQTSRKFPDLWVVGTPATALHKPSGEREVAYITLPAICKLEAESQRIVENQSGFTIVEEMPNGDRLVHVWNFGDLIAREREFITGIKDGAKPIHKKIIDVIKREGARHPGRLAEELGVDRELIKQEIAFLVEEKSSSRLTWPALRYDPAADRYDFHKDWIRRSLRYRIPEKRDTWREDSFLLLGCLHAGYTTTDYRFVVETIPEKMLEYGINILVGGGDFIGGLHHEFLKKGAVFNLTNDEQEGFAAEITGTILIKVFSARLLEALRVSKDKTFTTAETTALVMSTFPFFPFIKGNHDKWSEVDGQNALQFFHMRLKEVLHKHIRETLKTNQLPNIDVDLFVEDRICFLKPHLPIFELPSGLRCAVIHPETGRAGTSVRLEREMERFSKPGYRGNKARYRANAVFVANFHTAVQAHKRHPLIGQCVGIQTGAPLLLTDFEFNKGKEIDFGVQMLKTLSINGRIMKTTVASFNKMFIEEPYSRRTDIDQIRKDLKILS